MSATGRQDGAPTPSTVCFAWMPVRPPRRASHAARLGRCGTMFAQEIRRQAEEAPQAALPAIAAALWQAFSTGALSETEAEELSSLIDARRALGAAEQLQGGVRQIGAPTPRRTGSRPRTDTSMERRRRWAASGRLPPQLAAQFTLAEQAVLAVVAVETTKRGDCRLANEHIAAVAGVSKSTARATLRRARALGLLTIEERRRSGWRSETNVIRIVSREWVAWMRLARRSVGEGGGVKSASPTVTQVPHTGKTRTAEPARGRIANPNPLRRAASRAAGA